MPNFVLFRLSSLMFLFSLAVSLRRLLHGLDMA
jgi:hypothetical protein